MSFIDEMRSKKESEYIRNLCERLWDSEDPDCKFAEELGFKDELISLFADNDDSYSFIRWLNDHNFNIAYGFRDCDYEYIEDIPEDELEFKKANALTYNDKVIIMNW